MSRTAADRLRVVREVDALGSLLALPAALARQHGHVPDPARGN